jgi:hypothetical protein
MCLLEERGIKSLFLPVSESAAHFAANEPRGFSLVLLVEDDDDEDGMFVEPFIFSSAVASNAKERVFVNRMKVLIDERIDSFCSGAGEDAGGGVLVTLFACATGDGCFTWTTGFGGEAFDGEAIGGDAFGVEAAVVCGGVAARCGTETAAGAVELLDIDEVPFATLMPASVNVTIT